MNSFTDDALATARRRLSELKIDAAPVQGDELEARFGRRETSSGSAFHAELSLDGAPCVLTVTALDQAQVDDYGPVRAVSDEVGRLQSSGRVVAYHQVMVAPRGTVLVDLVGPPRSAAPPTLETSAERLVQQLLDHEAVRPLLK
jgi:hypothetical protein